MGDGGDVGVVGVVVLFVDEVVDVFVDYLVVEVGLELFCKLVFVVGFGFGEY